jgi:hypothetical protein
MGRTCSPLTAHNRLYRSINKKTPHAPHHKAQMAFVLLVRQWLSTLYCVTSTCRSLPNSTESAMTHLGGCLSSHARSRNRPLLISCRSSDKCKSVRLRMHFPTVCVNFSNKPCGPQLILSAHRSRCAVPSSYLPAKHTTLPSRSEANRRPPAAIIPSKMGGDSSCVVDNWLPSRADTDTTWAPRRPSKAA